MARPKKSNQNNSNVRTRNWTIIIYPDSAPENWRDIIDEEHIEWIESPLHDKDINPDGTPKKKHYHVLLLFGGVKSYEQVLDFIQPLNCPIPKRVHNAKALVRYMAHLDHPDKEQYNVSKIAAHGGVDIYELLKANSSEKYTIIKEMITFIKEFNIDEFQDLVDYAIENHYDDWFPIIADNSTILLNQYIKSQRHRKLN